MVQNPPIAKTPGACPIDHVHLARYTMGNKALELEVLQLFAGQAPETLSSLAAARDDKSWHIAAHTLKGSARAVGAFALAAAAEAAEKAGPDDIRREAMLDGLRTLLAEAGAYIDGLAVPA